MHISREGTVLSSHSRQLEAGEVLAVLFRGAARLVNVSRNADKGK